LQNAPEVLLPKAQPLNDPMGPDDDGDDGDEPRGNEILPGSYTPNCPSRGEIPKILKLAWGKAFVEVVAMRRLACV